MGLASLPRMAGSRGGAGGGKCTFISAASPTPLGGRLDLVTCMSWAVFFPVGPQNSKYTFKNEQAINGNNMYDSQSGRQEVND